MAEMTETRIRTKPKAAEPKAAEPRTEGGEGRVGMPGVAAAAILQSDLTEIQIGIESTAGTLVAATQKIPFVSASYQPIQERKTLEEKGTVLADTTDVVTRQGSELELTEELNTETLIGALRCCVAEVAAGSDLSGAEQWTFVPTVNTPSSLATATIEVAATDGTSTGYMGRFGFARPTAISIEASGETAQITTSWMGRAKQALSAATALTPAARFIIPAQLFAMYIDDTWATLGTTQYGLLRSFTFDLDPGLVEAPALAGRSDLDIAYWRRGRIRGGVTAVVDHDGPAGTELAHWEAGDLRFIRFEASNGGTGAALRRLRIDMATRYVDTPDVLASDAAQHTLDLASMLRADASGNILSIDVVNGLAAW